MARRWKHSVTVYLTEAEYLSIKSKALQLETSSSSFTKEALKTYIKHLEKPLKNAEPIAV
ncbi:hypothetical protein QUA46_25690 [Microcoleus sp. MON2_D6]|uniref:hypothetical protein n=1 Tax=unclassified Microcoleus TaxID=2642155 RepID=UPI002FD508F6